LAAIKRNSTAMQDIENPSETFQLAAVQQNGYAIRFIKNPSEVVQLAAVQQNGYAIGYFENPSEAVQLAAVQQKGKAIYHIEHPSEAVQLAAVKQNPRAIYYINNPTAKANALAKQSNCFRAEIKESEELGADWINDNAAEKSGPKADGKKGKILPKADGKQKKTPGPFSKKMREAVGDFSRGGSDATQLAALKQNGHVAPPTPEVEALALMLRNFMYLNSKELQAPPEFIEKVKNYLKKCNLTKMREAMGDNLNELHM